MIIRWMNHTGQLSHETTNLKDFNLSHTVDFILYRGLVLRTKIFTETSLPPETSFLRVSKTAKSQL